MSKYYKKTNRAIKAHTKKDKRYARQNTVKMHACYFCSEKSLVEKKENGDVWADCRSCGMSGWNARFEDAHIFTAIDVVNTLRDAYD